MAVIGVGGLLVAAFVAAAGALRAPGPPQRDQDTLLVPRAAQLEAAGPVAVLTPPDQDREVVPAREDLNTEALLGSQFLDAKGEESAQDSSAEGEHKREPYDSEYYDSWLDPDRYGPNGKAFAKNFDLSVAFYEENEDIQELWYMHRQLWAVREQLLAKDIDWAPMDETKEWCEEQGYDTDDFWPVVEEAVAQHMKQEDHNLPPIGGDAVQLAIYSIMERIRTRGQGLTSSPESD